MGYNFQDIFLINHFNFRDTFQSFGWQNASEVMVNSAHPNHFTNVNSYSMMKMKIGNEICINW